MALAAVGEGRIARMVLDRGKQPILFNVPPAHESMFPPGFAQEIHGKRDYTIHD